jgi:hypothetical protein
MTDLPSGVTTLDVLIATRDRPHMLSRALESLCSAHVPSSLAVTVVVIDNAGDPATRNVVASFSGRMPARLEYLHEPSGGKSTALNRVLI